MPDSIHDTLSAYYDFWFSCNALYEKWAKRQGITVNTLFVIYTVDAYPERCNQRLIVEKKADPSDKRNKRIVFTRTGTEYAGRLLKDLGAFEEKALGAMTREEREDFIRTSQIMLARLEEALNTDS